MTLKVTFELSTNDLKHFRTIMREAREAAKAHDDSEVIAAAKELLGSVSGNNLPDFVIDRLRQLRVLIEMLEDDEWRIPARERNRVLNALAYFTEPNDLIPDHIPGLGFLDDAIMVELVARELRHEIEAYEDFCRYRDEGGDGGADEEAQRLAKRRKALHERMRRRSVRERRDRRSRGGARLTLF